MSTQQAPPGAPAKALEDRFRSAYTATYSDLLRFVARRVHPSHAEDVVADAFLVAWRRIADLPHELDHQRAWVFGIARHIMLNQYRTDRRRDALAVRIAQHQPPNAGVEPELVAMRLDLARVWSRLPATDQEAIALNAWDGLDGPAAAAVLGITPVAYRLRLSRARRTLRRLLDLPHNAAAREAAASTRLTEGNPS